ncbi:CaiB/BaiF CoA transferase family protein [Desulfoscipio geothermicus]|uniref:Crotonobetainyl-CoA:carnitine CoA-transferase CaiB n=1 Tax=Desulfoscipio geothermicus DSM 3669 TaxID=1121426 RepID=A0A1I6CRA9_9FIRM|nr:CaiB/BaiF CoA-transferase family protein [Desulfoscipio geothermicus]SFQ95710.1 Crotonobetainyl-CoA:carnitine CoA-transferase CaiB [Desulfoscipio geothermicus DSM 3669]
MLKGIRVLDLSRLLPGPYATMLLGDLGAEVIKIEEPGVGDYMRHFHPQVDGVSVFFLAVNRNKKSITLNLKKERGKEIFLALARRANVIIEGFRPGVMDALGLGYESARQVNPGIVYCSLSGYGQDGPYRDRAGHDINYLSVSGVLGITGVRDAQPVVPGVQVADLTGGMFAVIGILSALWQKQREGRGAYLDLSMTDGLFSMMSVHLANLIATGTPAVRGDMMLSGRLTCYNVYRTRDDGYMALGALEDKFWKNFCAALEREDLVPGHLSPATEDNPVYREVREIFLSRTMEEWRGFAEHVDCCLTPVDNAQDVIDGDYARGRGLFIDVPHPGGGTLRQVRNPLVFPGVREQEPLPPPAPGQHNEAVYGALGLNEEELAGLKRDGII